MRTLRVVVCLLALSVVGCDDANQEVAVVTGLEASLKYNAAKESLDAAAAWAKATYEVWGGDEMALVARYVELKPNLTVAQQADVELSLNVCGQNLQKPGGADELIKDAGTLIAAAKLAGSAAQDAWDFELWEVSAAFSTMSIASTNAAADKLVTANALLQVAQTATCEAAAKMDEYTK